MINFSSSGRRSFLVFCKINMAGFFKKYWCIILFAGIRCTGDIGCYDFDGNQIWKGNLEKWYGEFNMYFVMASSPIVDGDRLYLQLIPSNIRAKNDKTAG